MQMMRCGVSGKLPFFALILLSVQTVDTSTTQTTSRTLSLPTGSTTLSRSISLSLSSSDTMSVSETMSLSLPTESLSLSLPSETESGSMTLPTASLSISLPSGTVSYSGSRSRSLSLGTETESFSRTGTYQSVSQSRSVSGTLSLPTESRSMSLPTETTSVTLPTMTVSQSRSVSQSASLLSYNNDSVVVAPAVLYEGEEFRVRIETTLQGEKTSYRRLLNTSRRGEFEIGLYEWNAEGGCNETGPTGRQLAVRTEYGVSDADSKDHFVSAAYATFVAPSAQIRFVICYRLTLDTTLFEASAHSGLNRWKLAVSGTSPFQAKPSLLWYYLPDPSVGQYAIIQILSNQNGNFSYSPSNCGHNALFCSGDSLKIVPKGSPCTYDYQGGLVYYGSNTVDVDGAWTETGVPGLFEGATAGGAGVFGTEYANPLVDTWSAGGSYLQNASVHVYVRLPQAVGAYEVCFSSKEERARRANSTMTQPVWRKLYRCTVSTACTANSMGLHFDASAEVVGWTMVDLAPGTWGDVVFDDGGAGQLSNLPGSEEGAGASYWAPSGGDVFRIVPAALLGEVQMAGRAHALHSEVKAGSFPMVGCWSRGLDVPQQVDDHGGFADRDMQFPIGSRDLSGDPTDPHAAHDAFGVRITASTLYVPTADTWHVCYRRTCNHLSSSSSSSTCTKHSGMRVLPFHRAGHGALPARWHHLTDEHLTTTHLLVPGVYGNTPPPLTWYMNDTRSATWGPFVVEVQNATKWTHSANHTATVTLTANTSAMSMGVDTRKWNYQRSYTTDVVGDTVGSILRLVRLGKPCDSNGFHDAAAESRDGGMVECDHTGASDDKVLCAGSASDQASVTNAAYYITVPDVASYAVCHRNRFFNWVVLFPSASDTTYFRPTTSALSTLSLAATETRAKMEALFLISDTAMSLQVGPRTVCTKEACPASADILRLVPMDARCDINPYNWNNGDLVDSHLSLICNVTGSGSPMQSGLYYDPNSVRSCALAEPTQAMCQNSPCNATNSHLTALTANTPDIYDDIVPHDHSSSGHSTTAAVVILPHSGVYKICFKQAGLNWAVFNETWHITPAPPMTVSPQHEILLGGEMKLFHLHTSILPVGVNGSVVFFAKLVFFGEEQNRLCMNQAGSTEGAVYSSATTQFIQVGADQLDFHLTIPHTPGKYILCIQLRTSSDHAMSWWRPNSATANTHDYTVSDNGARWYTPTGMQPTNQGLSTIRFVYQSTHQGVSRQSFAPGNDKAKIVHITSACHDTNASLWGASEHITTESSRGEVLGPTNGFNVAELRVVLPETSGDVVMHYKVCLKAAFGANEPRWVEVQQAEGVAGQHRVTTASGESGFVTQPGLVTSWSLNTALHPATSLFSPATFTTALGGTSTQFVTTESTDGFLFHTSDETAVSSQSTFKLILLSAPTQYLPQDPLTEAEWGVISGWNNVSADCLSPGSGGGEVEGSYPHLGNVSNGAIPARFQIPTKPGKYLVCYRRSVDHPWLQLSQGNRFLYVHPTFLEARVDASTKLSIFDLRTMDSTSGSDTMRISVASWCDSSSNCTNGTNFNTDLVAIVNETDLCPNPQNNSLWFPLTQISNESTTVTDTSFSLPPTGKYKLCVFKVKESPFSAQITKKGLVYQIPVESCGGWMDLWNSRGGVSPVRLKVVASGMWFNSTVRFAEYTSAAELQSHYGAVQHPAITDPATGMVSRTPLIASGTVVSYNVSLQAQDGEVPCGSYVIEVERCAQASAFADLGCTATYPTTVAGPFAIWGLHGACPQSKAMQYGWERNGLQQITQDGRVQFSLQFRSSCPEGYFGCGLRFKATTPTGEQLFSPSQWVNVLRQAPDSISFDKATEFHTKQCLHGAPCTLVIHALRNGSREYAPNGTISVRYSQEDYPDHPPLLLPSQIGTLFGNTLGAPLPLQKGSWGAGGEVTLKFVPILQNGHRSAVAFLNATYGEGLWTRFAVEVTRQILQEITPLRIDPWDVQSGVSGRTPSPAFLAESRGASLVASPGAYLEALVPYRMVYRPFDVFGVVLPEVKDALYGWVVTATVLSSENKVLRHNAEESFVTIPEVLAAAELKESVGSTFAVIFRVYVVDNACSRFGGGCTLAFSFSDGTSLTSINVVTPIRVPASTIEVTPSTLSGTMSEGILITARPGSYIAGPTKVRFVYDEFHYGEVFALSEGGVGVVQPDRTNSAYGCAYSHLINGSKQCYVTTYPTQHLSQGWGAQWTLRTTTPCNRCVFTFHTTWGAGPDSEYKADGSQRGVATLTWIEEEMTMECNDGEAFVQEGVSPGVSLNVTAMVVGANVSAGYARWWVVPSSTVAAYPLIGRSMQMVAGVSQFDLRFGNKTVLPIGSVKVPVLFTAVGMRYRSGVEYPSGHRPSGTQIYNCTSVVMLTQRAAVRTAAPLMATTRIDLLSVSGGVVPLCASEAEGVCQDYTATVGEFTSGVTMAVRFVNEIGDVMVVDSTKRNVTVMQDGGVRSTQGAPTWTPSGSSAIVLDSVYNPEPFDTVAPHHYTYGNLTLTATRTDPSASGSVTLKYFALGTPCRKAVFKVCASVWDGVDEVVDDALCVQIRLWVRPDSQALMPVYIATPNASSFVHGSSATCGGAEVATFSVAPYYTYLGDRYWAYETQVVFTLSASNQHFVREGLTAALPLATQNNSVPLNMINHTVTDGIMTTFAVFGRDVLPSTTIKTAILSGGSVHTSEAYSWIPLPEIVSKWEVNTTVTLDDNCPTKRRLQTSTQNYRTYGPGVPGEGWGYASGAVVGVPFPIQTVVRTANGERAWSFPRGTLVRVTKRSWTACNNGGTLKVYDLAPPHPTEAPTLLDGTLTPATWIESPSATVPTRGGVAIPWNVLSAECEACTLQLDLCYSSNSTTCHEVADAAPIFADRRKLTKPFRVDAPRMDVMEVHTQKVPPRVSRVGEVFEVSVGNVQRFAGVWAMNEVATIHAWTQMVWVRSVWVNAAAATSLQLHYGHGGFLHEAVSRTQRTPCDLTPAEFRSGTQRTPLSTSGALTFFFTRPCGGCEVWLDYTLTPPSHLDRHPTVHSSFPLREYPQAGPIPSPGTVLVYTVRTCGVTWMLGNVPLGSVRRRRPFSMTALRVDAHNIPSWEGDESASFVTHGGVPATITSPTSGGTVRAVNGSATIRAAFLRSCYHCGVSFAGKYSPISVLTDATQIIAVPAFRTEAGQSFIGKASWVFDVYAADDLGDRAYSVGGPTEFALHRRYQTRPEGQRASAILTVSAQLPSSPKASLDGASIILSYGDAATMRIAEGRHVYNGIPMPILETKTPIGLAGQATVEVTQPVLQASLSFAMSGSDMPTSFFGEKRPPILDYSIKAGSMAVDALIGTTADACHANRMMGEGPCRFNVYAIGQGQVGWHVSAVEGVVSASVSCGACGAAEVTQTASFVKGVAMFTLRATYLSTGQCECIVTVVPPAVLVNASVQMLKVLYMGTALTQWKWDSSHTLKLNGNTAQSVPNRTVHIAMTAWDATGRFARIGGVVWAHNDITVDPQGMEPVGCFVCVSTPCFVSRARNAVSGVPTTAPPGDAIEIVGTFTVPGSCRLGPGVFSGFPTGTVGPASTLQVTVTTPARLSIVTHNLANFTHLIGHTLSGKAAAVTGVGTTLAFQILDANGILVTGDNHMKFTLAGTRVGTYNTVTWTAVARAGVGAFQIRFNQTTRTPECEAMKRAHTAPCTHTPWMFTVHATAPLAAAGDTPFASLSAGPLHFVRRSSRLLALANIGTPCVHIYSPFALLRPPAARKPLCSSFSGPVAHLLSRGWVSLGDAGARWRRGAAFSLKVVALSDDGVQTTHREDSGSAAKVQLRPLSLPCSNIDRSNGGKWILDTCVLGGRCLWGQATPQCRVGESSGWSATFSFALQGGTHTMQDVANIRSGPARFTLTAATTHPTLKEGTLTANTHPFEVSMQDAVTLRPHGHHWVCSKDCSSTTFSPPAGEVFSLFITIVDIVGDVVADSTARISVRGLCMDTTHNAHLMRYSGANLAYTAVRGWVYLKGLIITAPCSQMRFHLSCIECTGVDAALGFAVVAATHRTPPSRIPLRGLSLGKATSVEAALRIIASVNHTAVEHQVLLLLKKTFAVSEVRLMWICAKPGGGHILPMDRVSNRCVNTTRGGVVAAVMGVEVVTEMEVVFAVGVDEASVGKEVDNVVANDLAASSGVLRGSAAFGAASFLSIPYVPATPSPDTPGPLSVNETDPPLSVQPQTLPATLPPETPTPIPVSTVNHVTAQPRIVSAAPDSFTYVSGGAGGGGGGGGNNLWMCLVLLLILL